jgi:peptide/nickel transport system permease protein
MLIPSYVIRRLVVSVPTVIGVATLVFALIHVTPGDPIDAMLGESATPVARAELRSQLGLDRPLHEQYFDFLGKLARGDLGHSIHSRVRVTTLVADHFPMTLALAACALAFATCISVPLGLRAASRAGGLVDRLSIALSLVAIAIPNFWLGPILVLAFAIHLGVLPVAGADSPAHVILPAITLGLGLAALLGRMIRSSVLEALEEDYIRTARAMGASQSRILRRHALANALTPILSILGLQAGSLLAGSVITETVFSWPGLGRLTVDAIRMRDYPVVQGCVLVIAMTYVAINLVTDLALSWANPRIRCDPDG